MLYYVVGKLFDGYSNTFPYRLKIAQNSRTTRGVSNTYIGILSASQWCASELATQPEARNNRAYRERSTKGSTVVNGFMGYLYCCVLNQFSWKLEKKPTAMSSHRDQHWTGRLLAEAQFGHVIIVAGIVKPHPIKWDIYIYIFEHFNINNNIVIYNKSIYYMKLK